MSQELLIWEPRAADTKHRVWPGVPAIPPGFIQENRVYYLQLNDLDNSWDASLDLEDTPVEALLPPDSHTARWKWTPGFYAGSIHLTVRVKSKTLFSGDILTDPDTRKLLRSDFDLMLREILSDTYALFSMSGFKTGVSKGLQGEAPPIARLELLSSRLPQVGKHVPKTVQVAFVGWVP